MCATVLLDSAIQPILAGDPGGNSAGSPGAPGIIAVMVNLIDRWRGHRRKADTARQDREIPDSLRQHLTAFIASRPGVEVWVEEATGINKASLLLVAGTGEWTRRAVPSTDWARDFAVKAGLSVHRAGLDPYPQRMRDWDLAQRAARRRGGQGSPG